MTRTRLCLVSVLFSVLLVACGDEEPLPSRLEEGSWGEGPASLAYCANAEICEINRWASQREYRVVVRNEDAEVSSTDPNVLEIVSEERIIRESVTPFCFHECEATVIEELSVIVRTHDPGRANFVIHGPAGDQRSLVVNVYEADHYQVMDQLDGSRVEVIDSDHFAVRLEAFDAEGRRLAAHGSWEVVSEDEARVSPGIWDDAVESLDHAASIFLVGPLEGTLRITTGEDLIELPIDLW